MTVYKDIKGLKLENIVDTGTEGTKVALGTTAQRGSIEGQVRYNSTLSILEYHNGSEAVAIDDAPTVTSINPTTSFASGTTITVTGAFFSSAGTTQVKLIGNDSTVYSGTSVSVSNSTTLTFATPTLTVANEPYDVKVIKPSGLFGTLDNALDAGSVPVFTSPAGSVGTLNDSQRATINSVFSSVAATDADGQAVTHTIASGTLPNNLTLATNGTWTGTPDAVATQTTYTFTVHATDGTNAVNRQFSFIINPPNIITFDCIAGGGSNVEGAGGNRESGSGAGGFIASTFDGAPSTVYTMTVGAGGGNAKANGVNSTITGSGLTTITAYGGGAGANTDGGIGGSGGSGGGNWYSTGTPGQGTAGQGNHGSIAGGTDNWSGGGGGGKGAVGTVDNTKGIGGAGEASTITGATYAAGGDGHRYNGYSTNTSGGANTGDGAGGIGQGGSGRINLRILTSEYTGTTSGSPTITTDGDYTELQYTGTGSYTA